MSNEIESMTDRAADAAVVVEVFGKPYPPVLPDEAQIDANEFGGGSHSYANEGIWFASNTGYEDGDKPCWVPRPYSTDDNAARQMRNKIAELGLQCEFAKILDAENFSNHSNPYGVKFDFLQATPRQQVNAALRAVRERGGKRE